MILAIIQARMGSTRLPGKCLLPLKGKPVIEHIINRTSAARSVDAVIVATTTNPADDVLATAVESLGRHVYRGSETDVLGRFYLCAKQFPVRYIIRVTADDPLKDPGVIDRACDIITRDQSLDYVSNTMEPTFPEGIDIEVFRADVLERACHEANLPSEREHVTPFLYNHPGRFHVQNFKHSENLSQWRWTLDTPADLEFMQKVYDGLYREGEVFSLAETIAFIKKHPELPLINSGTRRNDGYLRAIAKEKR